MVTYPDDRRYSGEHLWLVPETGVVGITSFAADELGDIIYIELPQVGATLERATSFGVIESTKAVSDLYSPVSGIVVGVNELLRDEPGLLNSDPFGSAWIAKVELADPSEIQQLMRAEEYAATNAS